MDNVTRSPGEDKEQTVGWFEAHPAPGALPRPVFAIWVLLLAAGGSAWAGQAFSPRPVVVSVRDAGEIEEAAAMHAAGVVLVATGASGQAVPELARAAREQGLTFWVAARSVEGASALASADADGIAVILSDPERPASKPRSFDELLKMKQKGDRLAEALQRLKADLGRRMLAVCAPLRAIDPETAASAYAPVKDMARAGVVDWVCLSGAERYNFDRLRLLQPTLARVASPARARASSRTLARAATTTPPLHAGLFVDAGAAPAKTRKGGGGSVPASGSRTLARAATTGSRTLARAATTGSRTLARAATASPRLVAKAVLAAGRNPSCEAVWLVGFPIDLAQKAATDAVAAAQRREAERAAIEQAIQSGSLAVDQEVPASARNNQASVHGVAQSFTPSRDGACPLAEVYATIRGDAASDLKVEIRADADGRPGKRVLACATIPAFTFAHDPTYRWARAWFKPAAKLRKGERYWLYLPNAPGYVWGIAGNGATERGRAWSSHYDYSKHSWVFLIYLSKEARP